MGLVDFPGRRRSAPAGAHRSRERVYRDGKLLYRVGSPIPLEEAVRQGIVTAGGKAIDQGEVADKAVRQGETEDKTGAKPPAAAKKPTRRRRTPARPKPQED